MRINLALVVVGLVLIGTVSAGAQTPPEPRGYVAVKGGLNIERAEDNLRGTTAGGGVVAGLTFADPWAIEAEFWLPGAIDTNPENGRHRDTLFSVGFRRSFGSARVRPHVLVGATVGRTEDEFTTCIAFRTTPISSTPEPHLVSCNEPDIVERRPERFASTSVFPLVGAGAEIALADRIRLILDVRAQVWITSVIVRPAIGIGMTF
jgi:hypothetical protein